LGVGHTEKNNNSSGANNTYRHYASGRKNTPGERRRIKMSLNFFDGKMEILSKKLLTATIVVLVAW
jgi:hypothetical protein